MNRPSRRTCTSLFLVLATAWQGGSALAADRISYPARGSDIPGDSHWRITNFHDECCTLELAVAQWNGTRWTKGNGGTTSQDSHTWGVPLYAPANGVIASCWRNFPDNPNLGEPYHPDYPTRIFLGGNHVVIKTEDGHVISTNHFKQASIDPALCPPNADATIYPSTMAKEGEWRVAAYMPPGQRPHVREGQFIGLAGSSGRSSGPHLHIQMKQIQPTLDSKNRETLGSAVALPVRHDWSHGYESNSPQV